MLSIDLRGYLDARTACRPLMLLQWSDYVMIVSAYPTLIVTQFAH